MSIEPEDLLEEALRADLPSQDAEARLRRRLLGAGLAVGNGIAATTAAAAGTGAVAKAATLSWGLKVGLAAAVAIPSVGLLWEHSQHPSSAVTATAVAPSATHRPVAVPEPAALQPVAIEPALTTPLVAEAPRARVAARRDEPSPSLAATALATAPSQNEFAAPEAVPLREASAVSTLREETQLLDRAFAALGAGNQEAARRLVAEHESRYPQGLLVKERERAKIRLSELSRGE